MNRKTSIIVLLAVVVVAVLFNPSKALPPSFQQQDKIPLPPSLQKKSGKDSLITPDSSKVTSTPGRYILLKSEYDDEEGYTRPVTFRIDTQTGETSLIGYQAFVVNEASFTFHYYEKVYEDFEKGYAQFEAVKSAIERK